MDSIKNSANFELSFIYFYEQYAWFICGKACNTFYTPSRDNTGTQFVDLSWLAKLKEWYSTVSLFVKKLT